MRGLIKLITTVIFLSSLWAWAMGFFFPHNYHHDPSRPMPMLGGQQAQQILYGDRYNAGHLYGYGKNCKGEFPRSWNAGKILATIKKQAGNDTLDWQEDKDGNQNADSTVEGIKIHMILNGDRTEILTAYPLNTTRQGCFNP